MIEILWLQWLLYGYNIVSQTCFSNISEAPNNSRFNNNNLQCYLLLQLHKLLLVFNIYPVSSLILLHL